MSALFDELWRAAIAVVPLAIVVAVAGRLLRFRPSTRHVLWLSVLAILLALPLVPAAPTLAPSSGERSPSTSSAGEGPTTSGETSPSIISEVEESPPHTAITLSPEPSLIDYPLPAEFTPDVPVISVRPITAPAPRLLPAPIDREPDLERAIAPSFASRITQTAEPVPATTTTSAPTPPASIAAAPTSLALWRDRLVAARDLLVSLPPVPPSVWWGGAALVTLVAIARVLRFKQLLRAALPASTEITREVARTARALGVKRPPQTLMTAANISPMLWCGRRIRLLLPRELWAQLDSNGRQAVLCHELAHLRRRDHWVCWLTLLAGCIYWWHPVVWWMKRELGREADLSCDAWVVALFPSARRAYATALLETKRFTSSSVPPGPTVGLGVSTLRARRFARRLAMVMSHSRRPEITPAGAALAALVAVAAWLVTPIFACPPERQAPSAEEPAYLDHTPPAAVFAPMAPVPPRAPTPRAAPAPDETTFEAYMRDRGGMHSFEARLEAIERKLTELARQLGHDEAPEADQKPAKRRTPAPPGGGVSAAPVQPRAWSAAPAQSGVHSAQAIAELGVGVGQLRELAQLSELSALAAVAGKKRGDCDPVTCPYPLPEGKLEALTALMSRSDVPIVIAPGHGKIDVTATPEQHRLFQFFLTMISDEGETEREYHLSPGKAEALIELMSRSDVPVMIEANDNAIVVHGSDLQQHVFCSFLRLIEPELGDAHADAARAGKAHAEAAAAGLEAVAAAERLARHYELQAGAEAQVAQLDSLRAVLAEHEAHRREFEARGREMEKRAEQLADEADRIEEKADELEEQAEVFEGNARLEALARANELREKARALADESDQLETEASHAEEHAEALEDEAGSIEEQIEQIEEILEERHTAR